MMNLYKVNMVNAWNANPIYVVAGNFSEAEVKAIAKDGAPEEASDVKITSIELIGVADKHLAQ